MVVAHMGDRSDLADAVASANDWADKLIYRSDVGCDALGLCLEHGYDEAVTAIENLRADRDDAVDLCHRALLLAARLLLPVTWSPSKVWDRE